MAPKYAWSRWIILGLVVVTTCSCSRFDSLFGSRFFDRSKEAEPAPAEVEARIEGHEAQLEAIVRGYIKANAASDADRAGRLVERKPHYYREYIEYPEGPDAFEMAIREVVSRSAPYLADVTVKKQRYATQLHRKKKDARDDPVLFRGTGTETMTYELRNGKWRKLGSLFVADRFEENVNGEWVPVQETVDELMATELAEPERGWLGRAWSNIAGR